MLRNGHTSSPIWIAASGRDDVASATIKKGSWNTVWRGAEKLRERIADLLNVYPDDIIFVTSTTRAIDVALECSQPALVITTDQEHDSEYRLLDLMSHKYGTRVVKIPVIGNVSREGWEADFVERVVNASTGNKETVLLLSHVCFANGWVLPVQDICTRLSKLNPRVPVIVDGAHAIGQLEVSLAGFPFRFYAFSGHKWLFGPPSLGILVLSQEIRLNNDQLHKRLLLEVYEALAVRQGPLDERTSTISLDPLAGLAASIAGIAEPGFPEVWRNLKDLNHTIAHYLVNECEHAEKLPSLGPKVSDGILNVQRKGTRFSLHELRDARERLEREHFVVTKVVSDPLSLRLCIPFYLRFDEVQTAIRAVDRVFSQI